MVLTSTVFANLTPVWFRGLLKLPRAPAANRVNRTRCPFDPSRPLAFMHIPKTAGTSLIGALVNAVQPRSLVAGFDKVLFGDFDDFASLDCDIQRNIYTSPQDLPDGDVICGHMSLHTIRQRYPTAQVFSLLREPFSRLLSHWLYWRGRPDEEIERWRGWGDRVKQSHLPLTAFLKSRAVACPTDNIVVRMLLWPHPLIPDDDFISPCHDKILLADARAQLSRFSLLDVIENPDLEVRLREWLGIPLLLERSNVTGQVPRLLRRPLAEELTPEAFHLMEARSRLDLRLWHDVARKSVQPRYLDNLRDRARLHSVARHAQLMAN
jgi:Sulfotransferase family